VRPEFCCAGCQFVHDLIVRNGLTQYYDLREAGLPPVRPTVFEPRDYAWLEALAAESPGDLRLDLQGISCLGCVWLIRRVFERMPGAIELRVDAALGRMQVRYDPGAFDVVRFAGELQRFGYLAGPPGAQGKTWDRTLVVRLGICAALAMNAMLFTLPAYLGMEPTFEFAGMFAAVAFGCGTASLAVGGSYFFSRAWQSLRRGMLHIDLPIALGLIAAYAGSVIAWRGGARDFAYFDFVSIFTFLMLGGRWLQQVTVASNRNRLLGLETPVQRPSRGDALTIKPGEVVPVQSKLLSGAASLSMEWISGEAEPRQAAAGQIVASGAINVGAGPVAVEAMEDWSGSLLARLLDRGAPDHRDPAAERFIRRYLFVVLAVALGASGAWLAFGAEPLVALQVLTSILVVSCPCATGVALPLADELAASRLRRAGVFLREPSAWGRLPRVRRIVFDKTGTLTLEHLALGNPEALGRLGGDEAAVLLAMVRQSLHPVGVCLRENLMASGVEPAVAGEVGEVIGFGLEMEQGGATWRLGRGAWATGRAGAEGTVFAREGVELAAFEFAEETRGDAREEVGRLRERGYGIHILSGDRREKVAAMAARLGLPPESAHGEMTPDGKAAWVRAEGGGATLMVGDGANDSLAFDASLCTATPAIERGLLERKADFYFLGRGVAGIRLALATALRRRLAARRVVGFAIAYNIAAVSWAAAGGMNPLIAAVIMPLSSAATIGIVGWSLRRGR
jgi:Cu2+-exporting ATPase